MRRPDGRPRGILTTAALSLALALTSCTGATDDSDPAGGGPEGSGPAAKADPPTPAERLGLRTGWGPTQAELEKAARLVGDLPLPALAGQVIVAAWAGTRPPVDEVRRLHLGGVIAFSDNVVSSGQIRGVNAHLRRAARRDGRTWPLLVAVDQEGGIVQRVRGDLTRVPSFMTAGAAGDTTLTQRVYADAGAELRGLGFTMDLAPTADVTIGAADPAIGSRSVSSDPSVVTRHVMAAAKGLQDSGVVPVVKHFPGHGSVTADSHLTLPVQRRRVRALERTDWKPFRAAVEAGLPAVMVGHLDVRALDPGVPSSLSKKVVTGALRTRLGFQGLVVTDALDMAGARRHVGPDRAAVAALRAGADVALMPEDPAAARRAIVRAVRSGFLRHRRLEQAAARMVALLLHQQGTGAGRPPGAGSASASRMVSAALTSVAGPCSGSMLPSRPVPLGDPTAVASFRVAAARAGVALGRIDLVKPPKPVLADIPKPPLSKKRKVPRAKRLREQRQAHQRALRAAVRRWERIPPKQVIRGTRVDLVGYGDPTPPGQYVVAVDTPYVLGRTGAAVRVATYTNSVAAMEALVGFWLGKRGAPGRLPVPVPGVRRGC